MFPPISPMSPCPLLCPYVPHMFPLCPLLCSHMFPRMPPCCILWPYVPHQISSSMSHGYCPLPCSHVPPYVSTMSPCVSLNVPSHVLPITSLLVKAPHQSVYHKLCIAKPCICFYSLLQPMTLQYCNNFISLKSHNSLILKWFSHEITCLKLSCHEISCDVLKCKMSWKWYVKKGSKMSRNSVNVM